jgi:hypothetical protein
MIEVVYCSIVKEARIDRDLRSGMNYSPII